MVSAWASVSVSVSVLVLVLVSVWARVLVSVSVLVFMSNDVIDEITALAARAMAEWMKAGGIDIYKPVHAITPAQMQILAKIAWDVCTVEYSKAAKAYVPEPVDVEQLDWLMGG